MDNLGIIPGNDYQEGCYVNLNILDHRFIRRRDSSTALIRNLYSYTLRG